MGGYYGTTTTGEYNDNEEATDGKHNISPVLSLASVALTKSSSSNNNNNNKSVTTTINNSRTTLSLNHNPTIIARHGIMVLYDNCSYAKGSESSFTAATEAVRSMALKSIPYNDNGVGVFGLSSGNSSGNGGSFSPTGSDGSFVEQAPPPPPSLEFSEEQILQQGVLLSPPESFEYDRPVNLRKDMLTSTWSGRMILCVWDGDERGGTKMPNGYTKMPQEKNYHKTCVCKWVSSHIRK